MADYFYRSLEMAHCPSVHDKEGRIWQYIRYMLDRTQQMFVYSGLPETVPARMLEYYLQVNGNVIWSKVDGDVYVFVGGLGGEPDPYYRPTVAVISNPALSYTANLIIGKDCEIMLNDSMYMGLIPMYHRYAEQMVENDLTIYTADINSRIVSLLSAADDRVRAAAEEYLRKVKNGELGVIADSAFLEGIKTQPYATSGFSNQITQLIELQQYLKASWFNEVGLQSNYNMKRESINSDEAQLNEQQLLPFVDNMLACRRDALERVNKMFGLDIIVELSSSWEIQHNEMSMGHNDEDQPEICEREDEDQSERTEPGDEAPEEGEEINEEETSE